MAVKMHVLFVALVFAGVAMPIAHAQLGLGGIVGLLNSLVSVTGIVPCSVGGSVTSNGFANATVNMKCGGNTLGTTTTNNNGAFSIIGVLPILSGLLSSCNLVVATPLASCNVSLPSTGLLTAPLNLVSNALGILNFVPGEFNLVPGL